MNRKRVSFDFDDTLSEGYVQSFAKWCIEQDCEVWVVTARVGDDYLKKHNLPMNWNVDLWEVVIDRLGIPKERVIFTSYTSKHEFFWSDDNQDFLFHLDDDPDEKRMLEVHCPNIVAMNHKENVHWERELTKLVNPEY